MVLKKRWTPQQNWTCWQQQVCEKVVSKLIYTTSSTMFISWAVVSDNRVSNSVFVSLILNCDFVKWKNYLLNWQTSHVWLTSQFKQDPKVILLTSNFNLDWNNCRPRSLMCCGFFCLFFFKAHVTQMSARFLTGSSLFQAPPTSDRWPRPLLRGVKVSPAEQVYCQCSSTSL